LIHRLRAAGCVFADDEADVLLESTVDEPTLLAMVARREAGQPLEHVVGWAEFAGMRLAVGPGVFVPRRRTEFLARLALEEVALVAPPRRAAVVDLCCGAGPIAAVMARRPRTDVFAVDVDAAAVQCARRNLDGVATVLHGDLFDPLPAALAGNVDVIVANAPYVPTDEIAWLPREAREYEPMATLDGGADGVALHRRIAAVAPRWLRPGGRLLVETSPVLVDRTLAAFVSNGLLASVMESASVGATVVLGRRG
jgi:release factor glutamine methyltransferase